jgi:hypothetical protein
MMTRIGAVTRRSLEIWWASLKRAIGAVVADVKPVGLVGPPHRSAPAREVSAHRGLDGSESAVSPSSITPLASSQITATDTITIELVEADETPAVIILRWPAKPTVCRPRRFPDTAATLARLFADAATTLARIKARRPL